MSAVVQKLPPNPIARFYRGGRAIAALRGFAAAAENTPEEWVGSATTAFGKTAQGLSRLADGSVLRDALAAEPDAWLGAAHVARFGADPALLVKLLDAGERLPVHTHPDGSFAARHLGTRFGKTEAWIVLEAGPAAQVHIGFREAVAAAVLEEWTREQDRAALLGALHPVGVAPGDALFVPAGVAHAIGEGVLIAELQEPTDFSIMLEWKGFGIADADEATLGLGWELALRSVDRAARDPQKLSGPAPEGAVSELLPPAAAPFFRAERIAPAGAAARMGRGFAVLVVTEGAGAIGDLAVERGDAVVVPHAAGDVTAEGELVAIACRPPEVRGG